MIKRYNQFSKTRLNEYFTMEETDVESTKSILPIDRSKNMMTSELDSSVEYGEEEEEVGIDKYTDALKKLCDASGENFTEIYNQSEKSIELNGRKISFPAETEKYHVEGIKKPFATVEELLAYFETGVSPKARQEVRDEISSIKDEEVLDRDEQFESKSYKFKRNKR